MALVPGHSVPLWVPSRCHSALAQTAAVAPTVAMDELIEVRGIRPPDLDDLSAFYGALSPEVLHSRFLGTTGGLTGSAARQFCTLDHMHDEGFVALIRGAAENRVV